MKNFIYVVCLFIVAFNFVSCQSENFQIDTDVVSDGLEKSSIHVIYDGKDYYSQISYSEDSLIIEDASLASLIEGLYANSVEVQTILRSDGALEYFCDRATLKSKYPFVEVEGVEETNYMQTKGSDYYEQFDGYALMWIDENYSGLFTDAVNFFGKVPQEYNLNTSCYKKISSIQVYCKYPIMGTSSKLECFEDTGRHGYCLTIWATSMLPYKVQNLKSIPYGKKGNWNDRISSIKFSVTPETIFGK